MPNLINKTSILADLPWLRVEDTATLEKAEANSSLSINLSDWLTLSEAIHSKKPANLMLELVGHDEIDDVKDSLNQFSHISIYFKEFKDGRGYSLARLLRDRFDYKGQLRATGDITYDQLLYLSRCGFDAFELRSDQSTENIAKAFVEFSDHYQAAADETVPVYEK